MIRCRIKYLNPHFQKAILLIALSFSFALASTAQVKASLKNNTYTQINPLLLAAFKKPINPSPLLAERVKPSKNELMYWPAYYLTAQQIQYRNNNLNRSVGSQIAHDIISNYVNAMVYGKKTAVVVTPRF